MILPGIILWALGVPLGTILVIAIVWYLFFR